MDGKRGVTVLKGANDLAGVSTLRPRMATNVAQHKIVNLCETL